MIDPTVDQMKHYGIATCTGSTMLIDAARRMVEEERSALIVVNDEGLLEGIISRTDLLRAKVHRANWMNEPVQSWMSKDVVTVLASAHLSEAARLLLDHQIHQVVAVNQEDGQTRPLAVITDTDILYHMTKEQYFNP